MLILLVALVIALGVQAIWHSVLISVLVGGAVLAGAIVATR